MKRPTNCAFALSFAQAVSVLLEACRLPVQTRGALSARVRQLQRLGLETPGSLSARKPGYGLFELAELASAIQMMAAFVLPKRAARYVTEQRAELLPFYLAGARSAVPADWCNQRQLSEKRYAVLPGSGLAELGQNAARDKRYAGDLGRITLIAGGSLAELSALSGGAGVVIDSSTYMPTLVREAVELAFATEEELGAELDRIYFGAFDVSVSG